MSLDSLDVLHFITLTDIHQIVIFTVRKLKFS